MLRNSFKFLSLVLAVSLTVAPISAIDGNSNSSRLGLGLAVFGLVCIVAYNYFSGKKASSQPVVVQKPVVENPQPNSGKPTSELQVAEKQVYKNVEKAAGRFTENKIVKSKVNFEAKKEADEVKKTVEEPREKSAIEPETEPANIDEIEDSKYVPGSYHMVTLDNLVLRHVEAAVEENKNLEQYNKITEARSTLKKTETNKVEHKSQAGRTALGNNPRFMQAVERNNKK